MTSKYAIRVKKLEKSYGNTNVLRGVDFDIERGSMVALLGPNGAGKTTTVRILSTLIGYDAGSVSVEGFEVANHPDEIRNRIGLTGQSASVDEMLTGRENLVMMGRLYRLTADSAKQRAEQLLEEFDLVGAADRPLKTYSGGMRRRLDLAVSLVATPEIIFLDEPTTGLDPRSRLAMWNIISELKKAGATILLTTQYLEEADQLADKIVVIDNGVVIAEGTSTQLKEKVGNDKLHLTFESSKSYKSALKLLASDVADKDDDKHVIGVTLNDTNKDVKKVLDRLAKESLEFSSMNIHKPTLDDVFLSITGKEKTDEK